MYIAPNSSIYVLRNVPLDITYEHTILFPTAQAQRNYFGTKAKYTLVNSTYQRLNRGWLKINQKSDDLYDCNYIMFQNTSYGSKWFYAFIKSIEYVNNETSQIEFEIDVMQTWMFDYTLGMCFVDRMHTPTDNFGQHIEPEPVELGEYVFNSYRKVVDFSDLSIVVAVCDFSSQTVAGTVYDGIYGGAVLTAFPVTNAGVSALNSFLGQFAQNYDAIVAMYMLPTAFLKSAPPNQPLPFSSSGIKQELTLNMDSASSGTIDGYTPKNNKLRSYPYNFLHIDNSAGGSLSLRYEFFNNNIPKVTVVGTLTQPVGAILYPRGYKGNSDADSSHNESISIGNFPMCSWNIDAYKAWVAQKSVAETWNSVSGIVGGGTSIVAGAMEAHGGNPQGGGSGIGSGATQILGTIAGHMVRKYEASIAADICKGNLNNGGVNSTVGYNNFYYGRMSITASYARMIDDFFTKFGYAINRVMTPNISSRPHWNYIKTVGCVIKGSMPCDDERKICAIYDSGITFWHNASEIGDYSLNNAPQSA